MPLLCKKMCTANSGHSFIHIHIHTHIQARALSHECTHMCIARGVKCPRQKEGWRQFPCMIAKDDCSIIYCQSSLHHWFFWWRNPVINRKPGCHQALRKGWNQNTRVIRVQRRNLSAERESSSPMVLHWTMSASTPHLASMEIDYPPASLCRNAQWCGARLPHIMKPCTRGHSPQHGLQQTEARKDPWCFFELLATHQFWKWNSGKTKKHFTYSLPRAAQCFPFCASIAAALS